MSVVNGFQVGSETLKYNYESLENYNTPEFSTSSSKTYTVGDYVMHNGKLYKCTIATIGGTWDANNWEEAILSDDVDDLSSAVMLNGELSSGLIFADWEQGGIMNSTGAEYDSDYNIRTNMIEVTANKPVYITGLDENSYYLWLHQYNSPSSYASVVLVHSPSFVPTTSYIRLRLVYKTSDTDITPDDAKIVFHTENGFLFDSFIRPFAQYNTTAQWEADFEGYTLSSIPVNSIVCIGSGSIPITDAPYSAFTGNVISLSANKSLNPGVVQLAYGLNGNTYYRLYKYASGGNYWTDWFGVEVNGNVYYVGPTRPYTSLTSLLIDIRNNTSKKTIYIDDGIYDVFAEYMDEVAAGRLTVPPDDITSPDYFYPYNAFVPNNTTIIGLGNVTLSFEPDSDEITYGASRTWSPLNIYGSVEIENITVKGHNCRYCLHNDDHNAYPNSKQYYKHCRFLYRYSDLDSQNRLLGFNNTIGFGIQKGSVHTFEDCEIYMDTAGNNSVYYGHEGGDNNDGYLILRNCRIYSSNPNNNRVIRLQTLGRNVVGKVTALFENCYINGGLEFNLYYVDSIQSFQTTFVNCNKVPIRRTIPAGGTVQDPYTVEWYNSLPTPTQATGQDPLLFAASQLEFNSEIYDNLTNTGTYTISANDLESGQWSYSQKADNAARARTKFLIPVYAGMSISYENTTFDVYFGVLPTLTSMEYYPGLSGWKTDSSGVFNITADGYLTFVIRNHADTTATVDPADFDSVVTISTDVKNVIDQNEEAIADIYSMIATVETTTTASKDYAVSDVFIYSGNLYKVTITITAGSSIVPGTNCIQTTLISIIKGE